MEAPDLMGFAGLNAIMLIKMIVKAANTARMHKSNCRKFAQYLKVIGTLLEQLNLSEMKTRPGTREPLEQLEDALRRAYVLVNSCQDRSLPYVFAMGWWNIGPKFKEAEQDIERYLQLIPVINLVEYEQAKIQLAAEGPQLVEVYRISASVLFHGSLLHVLFNMLAMVPLGSELERIMGSLRLLHVIFLLATSNAVFRLLIELVMAHNPLHSYAYLMKECTIGFSGIILSMFIMGTSLSGVQSRRYAWILWIVFQILMTNVSLLGHLCGILPAFAYMYGLFNYLLPGQSFYSAIDSSSLLKACVRESGYILCSGGQLPTSYSSTSLTSGGLVSGNLWKFFSSWMPQREASADQPAQDNRFPGRGRTLGSTQNQAASAANPDSNLQAGLLDISLSDHPSEAAALSTGQHLSDRRRSTVTSAGEVGGALAHNQGLDDVEVFQFLGTMDIEMLEVLLAVGDPKVIREILMTQQIQVEVALVAAGGDPNVAMDILINQQAEVALAAADGDRNVAVDILIDQRNFEPMGNGTRE